LVDSGALPELGAPGQDDIDRQLAQVTNQSAVDSQLAQLKASVQAQLPPAQEGQTREPDQLPPPAATNTETTDGGQ